MYKAGHPEFWPDSVTEEEITTTVRKEGEGYRNEFKSSN